MKPSLFIPTTLFDRSGVFPGAFVGCDYRWPHSSSHPDGWYRPHEGTVLHLDDPRAWAGSLAFPVDRPKQPEVTAHVQKCLDQGLFSDRRVPVLYRSTIDTGEFLRWDSLTNLRPYTEALKLWGAARRERYQQYQAKAAGGAAVA